jgi:diguanylate cyclase (GGDEF)-like protein/PAS domain S-box-containing protein
VIFVFAALLVTALVLVAASAVAWRLVARGRAAEISVERFFDLSEDMLCTATPDGYLVELNDAWERTLGYSIFELRARPFTDLVHPQDRERTEADLARVSAGDGSSVDFENRYRASDGSWRWLRWSSSYVAEQDLVYARATDVTERTQLLDRLHDHARTDDLTGLPNRRWLADELERATAWSRRHSHPLSVAVLDLDHFKRFNDEHGHPEGDAFLRECIEAWREHLRGEDFLARLGGEEFVIVLTNCGEADARRIVERLTVATPRGQTCSGGVATWNGLEHQDALISRADAALYAAKRGGRAQIAVAGAPA